MFAAGLWWGCNEEVGSRSRLNRPQLVYKTPELPLGGHHKKTELPGSVHHSAGALRSELPGSSSRHTGGHTPQLQAQQQESHEAKSSNAETESPQELRTQQQGLHEMNNNSNLGTAESTPRLQADQYDPKETLTSNPETAEMTTQLASGSPHEAVPLVKSRIEGPAELSWDYYTPELEGSNVPELESNGKTMELNSCLTPSNPAL